MSVPIKSMGKEVTAILSEHTHHSSPCPNKLNLIKGTTPMSFGAKTWPVFMFFVFVFENVFKCEIHKLYVSFCLYFFFFLRVTMSEGERTSQRHNWRTPVKQQPKSCRTVAAQASHTAKGLRVRSEQPLCMPLLNLYPRVFAQLFVPSPPFLSFHHFPCGKSVRNGGNVLADLACHCPWFHLAVE